MRLKPCAPPAASTTPLKVNALQAQRISGASEWPAPSDGCPNGGAIRKRALPLFQERPKSSSRASTSEETEACSKEVAHSRYRGRGAVVLRHGTHALDRAHLRARRSIMLLEPLGVAPAFLQHPVQVATQLPRRRDGRFGFPLRAEQALIVGPDGPAASLSVCTISIRIHLSQRFPAGPTPPCVVRPPELCVLGTSPA